MAAGPVKPAVVVAFIDASLGFQQRLLRYFQVIPDWRFLFLDGAPLNTRHLKRKADVIVLPASLFLTDAERFHALERPLVAYGSWDNLSACFLGGCSDYLREPFGADELFHRLASALPRGHLTWRGKRVVFEPQGLRCEGRLQPLRFAEFRILQALVRDPGLPVAREALHRTFSEHELGDSRVVDVHVSNLRRKLDSVVRHSGTRVSVSRLEAVRGVGYRLL